MGKITNARIRRHCLAALATQKGACLYCKEPLSADDVTADHLLPLSRGGTDKRENIVACCRYCNRLKGDTQHDRFFRIITSNKPPKHSDIALIWASRRIWKRTHKAVRRIESAVA